MALVTVNEQIAVVAQKRLKEAAVGVSTLIGMVTAYRRAAMVTAKMEVAMVGGWTSAEAVVHASRQKIPSLEFLLILEKISNLSSK